MTARFITAPDKLPKADPEEVHSKILMVDVEWHDIESLAVLAMTRNIKYDFYLFGPTSIDTEWLDHAVEEAEAILINNSPDTERHGEIKHKLGKSPKSISMGTNADTVKVPMDYIVKQLEA